ncbi:MAG TPA: UDP-3-O-acyl-N-acetylglucosamine deacetylase [Xanthobacteraceae bacterium]|jgi:UDP-3-O-[3-hydroxymyristoyl] N-acetylglucosamine deacetylase
MNTGRQTTLRRKIAVTGVGVHSGLPVTLTLRPAKAHTGIIFARTDLPPERDSEVRADVRAVTATDFATVLGSSQGPLCSTSEHVLAALSGLGVDNAIVELNGQEAPIMDGSAAAFVAAIDQAGIITLPAARRYLKVLRRVRVVQGDSVGELRPHPDGFRLEVAIEFDHPLIKKQQINLDLNPDSFRNTLSRARTFGFMRDVTKLWNAGYALGASFENTLVVTDKNVLNPEGLRFPDEFVRHKALDAVGDLALAGAPLLACYRSVRGGHTLNHAVLSALMADRSAWTYVDGSTAPAVRPVLGHADIAGIHVQPAFAPDMNA